MSECTHDNINITVNRSVVFVEEFFFLTYTLSVHRLLEKDGIYLTLEKKEKKKEHLFPNVRSPPPPPSILSFFSFFVVVVVLTREVTLVLKKNK